MSVKLSDIVENIKLKPCPFCGEKAMFQCGRELKKNWAWVGCMFCKGSFYEKDYSMTCFELLDICVTLWNGRKTK